MQEYNQIRDIICDIKQLIEAMEKKQIQISEIQNIQLTAAEINHILYHSNYLRFQKEYDLEIESQYQEYLKEIRLLVEIWEQTLQRRVGKNIEIEFWEIYEYFQYVDVNVIYQTVVQHFMSLPEGQRIEYLSLPHRYTFLKNKIDVTTNDFSLIAEHVELMANNIEKYKWLYEHLADYRSKLVLNRIIGYWFNFNLTKLYQSCETLFLDYYDLDVLNCNDSEVLVDLGAFTGDSVMEYLQSYGTYKKIYAYEITPSTYKTLVQNLTGYPNMLPIQKGVGSKSGTMFVEDGGLRAGNKLLDSGDTSVEVVTLDEDIKEPISIIKMDIEGAEKDALWGAVNHIKSEKPKLLVSAYHNPEDLFDIPCLINEIREDYQYYLRFHGHGCLWPCDYVLYAV